MKIRALAALGCIPCALMAGTPASAQTIVESAAGGPLADGRLVVFAAYAPRFTRVESRRVLVDGEVREGSFDVRNGPGRGAGAAFEIRAFGALRLNTSFAYFQRSAPTGIVADETTEVMPAADVLLSRVSVAVRFHEATPALQRRRLYAGLHAGPAYVLEIPRSSADAAMPLRPLGSWGIGAGFDAQAAIAPGVALHMAVEDYIVRWNAEELGRRIDESFAAQGLDTATRVSARASHVWLFRLGLAFIFH